MLAPLVTSVISLIYIHAVTHVSDYIDYLPDTDVAGMVARLVCAVFYDFPLYIGIMIKAFSLGFFFTGVGMIVISGFERRFLYAYIVSSFQISHIYDIFGIYVLPLCSYYYNIIIYYLSYFKRYIDLNHFN